MTRSWIVSIAFVLLTGVVRAAPAFEFERVEVAMRDGSVLIDADVRYELSDTALEALDHGVPLTFELHVQLRRDSAWIWQSDLVENRLRSVLRFHPLSGLFDLHDLQTGAHQSFATRSAALRALGKISNFPVTRIDQLTPGERYRLRMQTFLDIDALPLPLRPKAYVSRAWDLESEVWEWRLQP